MLPLTAMVLGVWWRYDQYSVAKSKKDRDDAERHADTLEGNVRQRIQRRTTTGTFGTA